MQPLHDDTLIINCEDKNINREIVNIIIAESLLCDVETISPEKYLVKDLLADSVAFIDLITNLCDYFSINISEEDLSTINRVDDLYFMLDKYTGIKEK